MNIVRRLLWVSLAVLVATVFIWKSFDYTDRSTFEVTPISGNAPLSVTFTINANDSDSTNGVYYAVVFGDEDADGFSRTPRPSLTHTYVNPGTYTAVATRYTECGEWECLGSEAEVGSTTIVVW
jgi:PKD repeat protein